MTAFRTLPQADRAAARVADRIATDAYRAAYDRGATPSVREVAPTLLAELQRLFAEAEQQAATASRDD